MSDGTELDEAVLDALLRDGRAEPESIARQLGADAEAVAAAIDSLEERGVVRGYRPVVDWSRADGAHAEAVVELNVELDRQTAYDDIAARIADHGQVRSLRLVSGDYDFALEVEGESMRSVSEFVSERIAPIPEVTQTVTHFVMETHVSGGIAFDDDEDDRLSVSP